jgi:hypothetical protein
MKNGTVSVFGEAIQKTAKERAHLIKLLQYSQKEYLSLCGERERSAVELEAGAHVFCEHRSSIHN